MNMHEKIGARRGADKSYGSARTGMSRGAKITLIALAVLAAVAAIWFLTRGGEEAAAASGAGDAATETAEGPVVSVMVPGAGEVTSDVRVTGSVAARRDLPVGVQGQGGMVTAVLVDEGDYVRAGQVLARIDKSVQSQQVAQLRAAVQQAEADADLAQSELERAEALVERGFISTADIERRTATRDSERARVSVAQAQLRAAQAQLGQLDVRAPEAGLVLDRAVEEGQVVGPGSGALFRIAQGGQMELRGAVAEQDLAALKPGQRASVKLIGTPTAYRGEVWMVEPLIDATSRQGIARITIAGDGQVRPGAFASGTIETGTAVRPILPETAVLGGGEDAHVFIIGEDGKVRRRGVRVAAVTSDGVVIADGLDGSERVVVSAGAFLNEGESVQPRLIEREG